MSEPMRIPPLARLGRLGHNFGRSTTLAFLPQPHFARQLPSPPSTPSPTQSIGSCRPLDGKLLPFLSILRHSRLQPPPCCARPLPALRGARLPSFRRPRHAHLSPEPPRSLARFSRLVRHTPSPTPPSPTLRSDGKTCPPRSRPICG